MFSRFAALAALFLTTAFGQAPEFEVASVRLAAHDGQIENYTPSLNIQPGRNLNFANISLRDLIALAYNLGIRQITGPDWLTNRVDIIAKVPADTKQDQIPLMLQALLAQRFNLKVHREQKTMQAYILQVNKGGLKMRESAAGDATPPGCARSFAETPGATLAAVCRKLSTAEIAQQIQTLAPGYFRDGPIVDRTGLKGSYDFKLEWITRVEANQGSNGPTMFDALERQLGLKLNSRKEPVENLIVDHADKEPTEN